MSSHISQPEVKINQNFPTESSIKKHVGSSHGLTLITLSLLDSANKDLAIELFCTGDSQLQDFSAQILGIIKRFEVIKVYIRSVKLNGVFQESYDDSKLEDNADRPFSVDQFKKNDVICDIEINNREQRWAFWRNPEIAPRTLRLAVK